MVQAHRYGYELKVGPIPEGLWVLHTCDVPACQEPTHWFLGTVLDNNRDRQQKGRTVTPDNRGSRHGMSKLTEGQIDELRALYATGDHTQNALAARYGIRQQQVSKIIRGESWGHRNSSSGSASR